MGEKVYKPIIDDGDHLLRSTDNPNRFRGLTRDENNKNPDIIEWEEYDLDDLTNNDSMPSCEEHDVQLTPEQQKLAEQIGIALGVAIVTGAGLLAEKYVVPWLKNTVAPKIKESVNVVKDRIQGKKADKTHEQTTNVAVQENSTADVSEQIDRAFEQFYFEMEEEEAKLHMMRLVYHMLGMANEIRIISNARIRKECQTDELCIEKQKEAEKFLSERVALGLDQFLSDENLRLDLTTSRELFSLTGGGVKLNGEYVPVQATKIEVALKTLPEEDVTHS